MGNFFPGSAALLRLAEDIQEVPGSLCWCGKKASFNTRVSGGKVVKEGEQIMLGGDEAYVALCRKHWARGELAPLEVRKIPVYKEKYMDCKRVCYFPIADVSLV